MLKSALYLVPTPIGNLEDITLRAVNVLREATLIAAEDTRHSRILLEHLGLGAARMMSCYDQVEEQRAGAIIEEIKKGGSVALISDAGSPLINDPGYKVVATCLQAGLEVVPLPGPCALITALEAAALPAHRFMFAGFLPVKQKELEQTLRALEHADYTAVFYESPRRIRNTCEAMAALLPQRQVALCRELTKEFESFYRMEAAKLPGYLDADPNRCRGEFVVVIGPAEQAPSGPGPEVAEALKMLLPFVPVKTAAAALSLAGRGQRRELYRLALKLMKTSQGCSRSQEEEPPEAEQPAKGVAR